jgi:hypothetical protein
MKTGKQSRRDLLLAALFALLSAGLIVLAFTDEMFFQWAFERHRNQLSWYIRPLFLIPFCFFAWRRSLSGIFGTMFLLLTSMFWFPRPETVGAQVLAFLQMEQEYLTGEWNLAKILISLLIPVSLAALAYAFWRRSLWMGVAVLVVIAVAKTLWSFAFGGASGASVVAPALIGLFLCIGVVWLGVRKAGKRKKR